MEPISPFSVSAADELAAAAHSAQTDRAGVPYVDHVRAVADLATQLNAALDVPFSDSDVRIAALLHDVVEDTSWTPEGLLGVGVPLRVVDAVALLSRLDPTVPYAEFIESISADRFASLIKLADNLHNSDPVRASGSSPSLTARYSAARAVLVPAVFGPDVPPTVNELLAR